MTDQDLRPPGQRARDAQTRQRAAGGWVVGMAGIAVAAGVGWYARDFWNASQPGRSAAVEAPAPAPEPAPLRPLEAMPEAVQAPSLPASGAERVEPVVEPALAIQDAQALDARVVQWLGSQALQLLVTPGLAHHIVATVDNLPRGHAAPRLWPLSPVGGRMLLHEDGQGMRIAPENSTRYNALVKFVTSQDPAQVAQWYRQAYPVLQQSYENLGYPGQSFHARLLGVLDHLLQTPQVSQPLELRLVQVQGQVAPQQPWLRYEYADPQLQSLSAGQRILLRLGTAHRSHLVAYLQALRAQLTP